MNYIVINKEQSLKPLQSVCSIVEKKSTLSILANVLLNIEQRDSQKYIELIGSDLEIQINYRLYVHDQDVWKIDNPEQKLSISLDAHKLLSRLQVLDAGAIKLQFKNDQAEILQQKTKLTLKTLPANDYPLMKIEVPTHVLELPQKQLKHQLSSIAFAMASQDVRYYLNAALLHVENQNISWVATDGHRLACSSSKLNPNLNLNINLNNSDNLNNAAKHFQAIVPKKAILEVLRLLDDSEQTIKISINANTIVFETPNFTIASKLIDGKYPDFKRLMVQHPYQLQLERLELFAALQRANIISQDKLRSAKWTFKSEGLSIYAINQDQDEIDEEIPSQFNGEAFETAFNITYWLDVLKNIKAPQLNICLGGAFSSAILDLNDELHHYTHVLMPMRV